MRGNELVEFFQPHRSDTDALGDTVAQMERLSRNARVKFLSGTASEEEGVQYDEQRVEIDLAWDVALAKVNSKWRVLVADEVYKVLSKRTPRRSAGGRRMYVLAEAIA